MSGSDQAFIELQFNEIIVNSDLPDYPSNCNQLSDNCGFGKRGTPTLYNLLGIKNAFSKK